MRLVQPEAKHPLRKAIAQATFYRLMAFFRHHRLLDRGRGT